MTANQEQEKFSPQAVTGVPFDEITRRALTLKPEKPKKASWPKKKK